MADTTVVRYVIQADNAPALKATAEVNRANESIGPMAERSAVRARAAFGSFTAAVLSDARAIERGLSNTAGFIDSVGRSLFKISEGALAGALALRNYTSVISGYSAAVGAAGASTEGLLNTYRLVRIALAPTPFTIATVAAGLLTEKTIALTYHTGQLIEARANLAAKSGIGTSDLAAIGQASNLTGRSPDTYTSALIALRAQKAEGSANSALSRLGLDPRSDASIDQLGKIGKAFDAITDPEQRARTAMQLFGSEFEKVLPALSGRLDQSIEKAKAFNSELSNISGENIENAKRNLDLLGTTLISVFDGPRLYIARIKLEVADLTADVINLVSQLYKVDPNRAEAKENLEKNGTFAFFGGGLFSPLRQEITRLQAEKTGNAQINRLISESTLQGAGNIEQRNVNSIRERFANSASGIQVALSKATSKRDAAFAGLDREDNDPSQDLFYQNQAIQANREIGAAQARLDAIEAGKRGEAESKATRTAIAIRQKTIRDQGFTAQAGLLDPFARSIVEFNKQGADLTQIRVGDTVRNIPLNADEVASRQEAFHALVLTHQKEELKAAAAGAEELYRLHLGYDESVFRKKTDLRIADDQRQIDAVTRLREFQIDELGFERDQRVRALDETSAQSVRQKVQLEKTKADIEANYLTKSLAVRLELFDDAAQREATDLRRSLVNAGLDPQEVGARLAGFESGKDQERKNLGTANAAAVLGVRDNAQTRAESIQKDAAIRQFDSIRQSANGLLDSLFSRSKSLGDIVASFFKAAVLTPLKEIASSQIARLIFEGVNPGQKVTFDASKGSGRFSGISDVFNRLGLGGPAIRGFGGTGGAGSSPVGAAASANSTGGGYSLPGLFGLGPSLGARLALSSGLSLDAETLGQGVNTTGLPTLPSGLIDRTGFGGGGNPAMAIGPGGTSGFAGPVGGGGYYDTGASPAIYSAGGVAAQGGGVGSGLGSLGQKALAGGKDFFGFGDGPGGTYGSGNYGTGIVGGLKSVGSSGFAATVGAGLVLSSLSNKPSAAGGAKAAIGGGLMGAHYASSLGLCTAGGAVAGVGAGLVADGLHRGGKLGIVEDAAGGALIGFEYGGPIGAAVGAAVGAIAGTIRLFIKGGREQITQQVKDLYRVDINPSIADQLLQLAKQSYGGSYSVAIRSKPALELISLYAQSTGQNFLFSNNARPAYLTETGGTAYQQSQTISNKAYSFGGALGVENGTSTSVIPSYVTGSQTIRAGGQNYSVPSFGSIQLDGPATTRLLQGEIVGNPTLVAGANASAQAGSYDRRASAARALSPGLQFG